METQNEKYAKEVVNFAKAEKPFSALEWLKEIVPLLKDYFIGEVSSDEKSIYFTFLNGQRVRLTAESVN